MRKFTLISICLLLGVCIIAGLLGWSDLLNGQSPSKYITVNSAKWDSQSEQLDLSGQELPDFQVLTQFPNLKRLDLRGTQLDVSQFFVLRQLLPDCNILWDIPFQSQRYDAGTSHLTVAELSEEDMQALSCFRNLRVIDATACQDPETVLALQQRFPNCHVAWQLTISGKTYTGADTRIVAADADPQELELGIAYLPNLNSIHLSGQLPSPDWLNTIRRDHPQITLTWEYRLHGKLFYQDAHELDLSGIAMADSAAVEAALPYFPELEKVILSHCGLSNEYMSQLNSRYDDVSFVWTVYIGNCDLRTDATVFMPFKWGHPPSKPLKNHEFKDLKYCTELICMDLGHMEVSDISFLNYMPKLQYLLLGDTFVYDITPIGSLKELIYLELFACPITDVNPLKNCTKLEDVNLGWIGAGNLLALKDLPNLKNVWLVGAYYSPDALAQVRQTHPSTRFCVYSGGSSTDYGWRELPNYYKQRDMLDMIYMTG